jgi:hypothetical protein
MVRPGLPLIASAFALFKIGAVPVIIDPGMGIRISSPASSARDPGRSSGSRSPRSSRASAWRSFRSVEGPRARERLAHGPDRRGRPRADAGDRRAGRSGGDPLHLGIHRRPEGRLLRARHVRRPGGAHPRDLRHRAGRGRPAAPPDLRALQSRARDDERHPGDRPAPPGPGRSRRRSSRPSARRASPTHSGRRPSGGRSRNTAARGGSSCQACGACSARARPCRRTCGRPRARSSSREGSTARTARRRPFP